MANNNHLQGLLPAFVHETVFLERSVHACVVKVYTGGMQVRVQLQAQAGVY